MLLLGFFLEFAVNERIAITFAEFSADELREFVSLLKQVTLDHISPDDERALLPPELVDPLTA